MASTASTLLKLELQGTGDNDGTWGTKANTVFQNLESAIAGKASVNVASADVTLTDTDYAANEARNMFIEASGNNSTNNRNVIVPARTKLYVVYNNVSGTGT